MCPHGKNGEFLMAEINFWQQDRPVGVYYLLFY